MNFYLTSTIKTLPKCKFLSLLLILFCSICPPTQAQQTKNGSISLSFKNEPIVIVFDKIEQQSGFSFFYDESALENIPAVNVGFSNENLQQVLKKLTEKTGLTFVVKEKTISVIKKKTETADPVKPSRKTLTGIITDINLEPIIGASVTVKGEKAGTITDVDGKFNIQVPTKGVLVISYIGFITQEISIGDKTDIQIILQENNALLEEVIVVGYGVQRKRDVTTSISSVRASDIVDMPVSNIEQALAGRMAGVQVAQTNGTPGAGFSVKVRGVGTVTAGSSPLYVVDGMPLADDVANGAAMTVSPLSSIEMNDIESIEVLKDASAAAIYGSRGSNGVVIITTKSGKEGKPVVRYDGYFGVQSINNKIDVLDAYEYSQLVFDGHNNTYRDQLISAGKEHLFDPWATNEERWSNLKTGTINTNQPWMMPPEVLPYVRGEQGLTNTDWQDAILRTGIIHKHNLSVAGGNKTTKYMVSGSYRNEEGVVIGSNFTKMGFRTKLDSDYNKFKFGGNINISRNVFDLVNSEGRYGDDGVLSAALGAAPIYPVYNTDGSFNFDHNNLGYGQSKILNPVAIATLIDDRMTALQMLATGYVQYDITKGLTVKTQGSWNYNNFVRSYYRPAALPDATNRTPPSNPTATSRMKNKYTWLWENTLMYKKKLGKHRFDALAGWTAQKYQAEANRITAKDLPFNDLLGTIPNTATATNYDSSFEEWSLLSGIARVQYNYDSRYLFSAAIRSDGSSRFGKNNRWGYFPSLSGAWYITDEEFMKPISWLSNLKLRGSWGVTGNMSIGNYASFATLSGDNYVFGNAAGIGMYEKTAGSPDIGWEKTSQVNLGVELGLFKWLNLEVDIYKGTTTDMLLEVPVLEYSGFSSVLQNIGKLSNKGIELTVSTNHKIGKVTWINSFNYSANRNKVISLGGPSQMVTQANSVIDFITKVGEPIGNYYTYVTDGVYKNQAEIDADIANGIIVPNAKPGDFRFKKLGNDDTINADDKAITGNYMPDFTYGYSTSLKYNMFDFSLSLQGVQGNEIANINRRYLANMEGNANQLSVALDRWISEENTGSGQVYRANRSASGMNSVISTWHIEDGSFIRIREITLGITLPKKITSRFGVSNLRTYLSAFNPFTFTKYSGYNPEVSANSSPIMQGVDYGTYPLAKSIVFGLNLNF